jgi:hypothetical protein
MSQLLPYLGVASLLLVVLVLWARQLFLTRKRRIEVVVPRKHQAASKTTACHRDLGERIFGLEDWEFGTRNMSSEIQEMFLRERAILAISWLRRTKRHVSLVMRAQTVAAQQAKDLQLAVELKLALNYLVFLILCDLLIGWIWLRGPVRTRNMVGRTLRTMAWLRGAFEDLIARIDPANSKARGPNFGQRAVRG